MASQPERIRVILGTDNRVIKDLLLFQLRNNNYEVALARSGRDIETKIEKRLFDAVILDVLSPSMGGVEMISTLKQLSATIPVIVVSSLIKGTRDDFQTEVMDAGADGIHITPFKFIDIHEELSRLAVAGGAFIQERTPTKKCPDCGKTLSKLARRCFFCGHHFTEVAEDLEALSFAEEDKGKLIEVVKKRFAAGKFTLPALPSIVVKVKDLLKNPNTNVLEIATLVKGEQTISTKLLALANSVLFGAIAQFTDVIQAITRLGLNNVESLVVAIAQRGLYDIKFRSLETAIQSLWKHAVASALACRSIAVQLNRPDPENYFLIGLIHDIGSVLALQIIADIHQKNLFPFDVDSKDVPTTIFNTHEEFGGVMLLEWNFDPLLAKAVRYHHRGLPEELNIPADQRTHIETMRDIIKYADCVAHLADYSYSEFEPTENVNEILEQLCKRLGVPSSPAQKLIQTIPETARTLEQLL